MLPDLPELKRQLYERMLKAVAEAAMRQHPPLQHISKQVVHEGDRTVIKTEDGHILERKMEAVEAPIEFTADDIVREGLAGALNILGSAAQQITDAQADMLLKTIEEATTAAGTAFSAEGQPVTPELLLDALERVSIDFDTKGNPILPTLYLNPLQAPRAMAALRALENDSDLRARHRQIIEKKRADWHDREDNRKLVE